MIYAVSLTCECRSGERVIGYTFSVKKACQLAYCLVGRKQEVIQLSSIREIRRDVSTLVRKSGSFTLSSIGGDKQVTIRPIDVGSVDQVLEGAYPDVLMTDQELTADAS